tara:strand:- start:138 stop:416 length:279 start_codon:yes stop_codon:yes gene_type:complete
MQNFTGTGFSNEEIKKEDIVKQVKSKREAIMSLREMYNALLKYGEQLMRQGGFLNLDKNKSDKAKQEANKLLNEAGQLRSQIIEYLEAMPHD